MATGRVKLSLDSNLLIYAAHNDDPRHLIAAEIVARAAQVDCIQSLQSLGECFNVLTRKRQFAPSAAMTAVNSFRALFPVAAADAATLDVAMEVVRAYKLQFWDALMLATVRGAGCRVLLSEDMSDGQEIAGVRILNPLKPKDSDIIDLLLPALGSHP